MSRYAKDTSVSVERSRAEIESMLIRYGADEFASGWRAGEALIGFQYNGMEIRFSLPLPARKDFLVTPARGFRRSESAAHEAWEQGCRQRWRALALVLKAKLEAVEVGITTFETEFLPHVMMPGGQTIAQVLVPRLEQLSSQGGLLKMLPASA